MASLKRLTKCPQGLPAVHPTRVPGVTYHLLTMASDLRGSLSAGEIERDVSFPCEALFLVFDVPTEETRGEHAHTPVNSSWWQCEEASASSWMTAKCDRNLFLTVLIEAYTYRP